MYKVFSGSRGTRRSFIITAGLRVGYGPDAKTHPISTAVEAVLDWMKCRAAAGKPYLTGTVSTGEVVYAWPEGPGKAGGNHEPTLLFIGEVSVLYSADLADEEVVAMLNELATYLGVTLGQTRVYVAYRDEIWVLQGEETVTPTGETVS